MIVLPWVCIKELDAMVKKSIVALNSFSTQANSAFSAGVKKRNCELLVVLWKFGGEGAK